MIESQRCCWTQCQTTTALSLPNARWARSCSSACVRHPVAVETRRHTLWQLDHGLGLARDVVCVQDVQRRAIGVRRADEHQHPAVRLRGVDGAGYEDRLTQRGTGAERARGARAGVEV